jgi:hypothetical protein
VWVSTVPVNVVLIGYSVAHNFRTKSAIPSLKTPFQACIMKETVPICRKRYGLIQQGGPSSHPPAGAPWRARREGREKEKRGQGAGGRIRR